MEDRGVLDGSFFCSIHNTTTVYAFQNAFKHTRTHSHTSRTHRIVNHNNAFFHSGQRSYPLHPLLWRSSLCGNAVRPERLSFELTCNDIYALAILLIDTRMVGCSLFLTRDPKYGRVRQHCSSITACQNNHIGTNLDNTLVCDSVGDSTSVWEIVLNVRIYASTVHVGTVFFSESFKSCSIRAIPSDSV